MVYLLFIAEGVRLIVLLEKVSYFRKVINQKYLLREYKKERKKLRKCKEITKKNKEKAKKNVLYNINHNFFFRSVLLDVNN